MRRRTLFHPHVGAFTQAAREGGPALAADFEHTQAAAFTRCAHPEIAIQLGLLVAAIEQQTAMLQH